MKTTHKTLIGRRIRRTSIRGKLTFAFVSLTILTAAIFTSLLYLTFRNQIRQNLRDDLTKLVGVAALQVDGDLHSQIHVKEDQNRQAFQQIKEKLLNIRNAGRDIYFIYTMRSQADGQLVFIVDAAEEDAAQVGEVYSDAGPVLSANFDKLDQPFVEDDFYTDQWGTWLSGYAPFYRSNGELEGLLGIDIAAQSILAQERKLLWACLYVFVGAVLFALLVGFWVAGKISSPISMIAKAANQIAEEDLSTLSLVLGNMVSGDLTQSITIHANEIKYASSDELGILANAYNRIVMHLTASGAAFNQMTKTMNQLVGEVSSKAKNLETASEQLSAVAAEASQATSQIAVTIQQVAKGTAQQSESVTRTAVSVDQMNRAITGVVKEAQGQAQAVHQAINITNQIAETVQQVSAYAQAGAIGSEKAAVAAHGGVQTVNTAIQGMENIQVKVNLSAQKVKEMGHRSEQIEIILEAIEDIASQTNLLALNAAIEAARAGEHGKGFAVVAGEVRKLAEKAGIATQEIGELVKDIQRTVSDALTAMNEGSVEVEQGVSQINQAGQALEGILSVTKEVAQQVAQIATAAEKMSGLSNKLVTSTDIVLAVVEENIAATEEMSAGSIEVTQAIENIASVSEENSATVEEVSASTEEMNAQVEEVTASTKSLAEMAEALQQEMSQFKLSA